MRRALANRRWTVAGSLWLLFLFIGIGALLGGCAMNEQDPAPAIAYGMDGGAASSGMHTVEDGETLKDIAARYQLSAQDIIRINNLKPPYKLHDDERLKLPAPRDYAVRDGDTLYSISHMFDVKTNELAQLNHLTAPYTVAAGQRLRLPAPPEAAAPATAAQPETEFSAAGTPSFSEHSAADPVAQPETSVASAVLPKPIYGDSDMEHLPATPDASPQAAPAIQQEKLGSSGFVPQSLPPAPVAAAQPALPQPEAQALPQPEAVASGSAKEAELPAYTPARAGSRFGWPVEGRVVSTYGDKPGGLHNDGINIAAAQGAAVHAADNGVVVYADDQLKGFGNLVLIRHADGWMTAYAHLGAIDVRRGQVVRKGYRIGMVGETGTIASPQLHFEIRHGTEALNPEAYMEERGISASSFSSLSPAGRGPG
jgi:murein DD-endopeptidase MepM/ murein hydrolase activator NlpD